MSLLGGMKTWPGIHPEVSCHHLNIDPKFPSHRQKRRPLNSDKYEALKEELVDATAGHQLLSFMDAYSGYNQIPMYPPDEEHTSFVTDKGLYCYKRHSKVLRFYRMRLNPLKCAFGVASEKFLGYMVNQRGIEANPEKINALIEMKSPKKTEGCAMPDWEDGSPKQIRLQSHRQVPPFL
ncbi:hypothetical protein Adt_12933 [Abeliophyllum distichum]|uniref:Reverse transcriptase n=1 Tax=Abeliophyllum distichum TaxID=126358 RepID=A0ABD1TVC3_9LAMI